MMCFRKMLIVVFLFSLMSVSTSYAFVSDSDDFVCDKATIHEGTIIAWNKFDFAKKYVEEAKKRQLKCNVTSFFETK
jgi:hypothetical protein